jgi:hypothetical protein
MPRQQLTLTLEGITAGDYDAWVRDPDPQALGQTLRSVALEGDPLGDTLEVLLSWATPPPEPAIAARMAGFPLTQEVVGVEAGGGVVDDCLALAA